MTPEDEWTAFLETFPPDERERLLETRSRMVTDVQDRAERNVIGSTWQLWGQTLFSYETTFDGRMMAPARELPFTWSHDLPLATMVRTRPRLRWLHGRRKTRNWAARHGFMDEYLSVRYSLKFTRPLNQIINTVTIK